MPDSLNCIRLLLLFIALIVIATMKCVSQSRIVSPYENKITTYVPPSISGGDGGSLYGGVSRSKLILLKKSGNGNKDYEVLVGLVKDTTHGIKLELPGGSVDEGMDDADKPINKKDFLRVALTRASEMTGKDYLNELKTSNADEVVSHYMDEPTKHRANVIIVVDNKLSLKDYDQNDEFNKEFGDKGTKWISTSVIKDEKTIDFGQTKITIPFYVKKAVAMALEWLRDSKKK